MPVFLTVHNLVRADISGALKARLYRTAERLAVRAGDRVFCVSEEIAKHLRTTVAGAEAKVEVMYLGVGDPPPEKRSAAEIREELGLEPRTRLVVTASRLAPQKALSVMFEALAGVQDAFLAVLGEGPLEDEYRAAAERLAPGRVAFLGFREGVGDYIRAAEAFCLSSVWEGVPLAAQEAILVETPVVATAVGGMPELIEDRVSGRLVPKNDAAALRDALEEVLAGGDVVHAYTERARADLARALLDGEDDRTPRVCTERGEPREAPPREAYPRREGRRSGDGGSRRGDLARGAGDGDAGGRPGGLRSHGRVHAARRDLARRGSPRPVGDAEGRVGGVGRIHRGPHQ